MCLWQAVRLNADVTDTQISGNETWSGATPTLPEELGCSSSINWNGISGAMENGHGRLRQ